MATIKKLPSGNWRGAGPAQGTISRRDLPPAQGYRGLGPRHGTPDRSGRSSQFPHAKETNHVRRSDRPASRRASGWPVPSPLQSVHTGRAQGEARKGSDGLNRERLIRFGKDRLKEGAGPVTVGMDLSYIKTITHAAAVHGIAVSPEAVDLARTALKHLGVVGRSRSRDRRPTADGLNRLIAYFDAPPGNSFRLRGSFASPPRRRCGRTICRIRWSDIDANTRTVLIRDRKDPRETDGNDQKVPLLAATGFDAWAILREQKSAIAKNDRIFPYKARSVGTAFRRACRDRKIENLHFHDLHHEKRYTNLRPEHLHRFDTASAAAASGSTGEPSPWAALAAVPTPSNREEYAISHRP